MASITLTVTGMKCGGCETAVKDALATLAGVASVHASHKENQVVVEYDEGQTDPEAIKKTIKGKGYGVS